MNGNRDADSLKKLVCVDRLPNEGVEHNCWRKKKQDKFSEYFRVQFFPDSPAKAQRHKREHRKDDFKYS